MNVWKKSGWKAFSRWFCMCVIRERERGIKRGCWVKMKASPFGNEIMVTNAFPLGGEHHCMCMCALWSTNLWRDIADWYLYWLQTSLEWRRRLRVALKSYNCRFKDALSIFFHVTVKKLSNPISWNLAWCLLTLDLAYSNTSCLLRSNYGCLKR